MNPPLSDQQLFNYRPITPKDLPLINTIIYEGKKYWGYAEEDVQRYMKAVGIYDENYFQNGFGFIVERDKETVGFYLFKTDEDPIHLNHFHLNTKFIGQGYGRLLWSHCIAEAKKKHWTEFTFWSDPNSFGFYTRMGALKIGDLPMITVPGKMAPIMKYSLGS